jgi:alpha-ketoglutarate-dependent taurine dioxygenase
LDNQGQARNASTRKGEETMSQFTPRNKSFHAATMKPALVSQEQLIQTTFLSAGGPTPLVVMPKVADIDLASWTMNNRAFIKEKLSIHGAILFRGFALHTQESFQNVLTATGIELMTYNESSTPRKQLGSQVYTSTEFPPEQTIALHNELSTAATFPLNVWFFALQPALQGGETPIADVRNVYKRLSETTRDEFQKRGWMLIRNYNDGFGLPWQEAFHTTDKKVVEDYCHKNAITFEWKDNDRLRTQQIRSAMLTHPRTGDHVWFNHMAFWHVSSLEPTVREVLLHNFEEQDLPYYTCYGDGSRIDDAVVEEVRAAYQQEKIVFPWEQGDLLMLDNMLVAHGRNPYSGERRILVGMGDPYTRADI